MKPITIVLSSFQHAGYEDMLRKFAASDLVERIIINGKKATTFRAETYQIVEFGPLTSQKALAGVLDLVASDYLLIVTTQQVIDIEPGGLEILLNSAAASQAGMVYSDYSEATGGRRVPHVLNDYQPGSVRDDFEFGPLVLFSMNAVREATRRHGIIADVGFAALYDLRLKISIDSSIQHIDQVLYTAAAGPESSERSQFAYVDPKQAVVQKEMENAFTNYLKEIGAYLRGDDMSEPPQAPGLFPVEASVIIPVKNRNGTIGDAVESAFSQKTDLPFNVIVVDNHSTDGTTAFLSRLTSRYPGLTHIVPDRKDLGIGGCWNEAVKSDYCGRYAVQLDSDDLYAGQSTLQRIIDKFRQHNYAMVIGSYTIVDFDLREIPPGLIDHREWTDENGRNNALRVNGMGAPRAYRTDVIRELPFLNVSYGEDYAAVLRICRSYKIGRIFENLYLCRRWHGNTDAELSIEARNANDSFKDRIRTEEILARQELNRKRTGE